MDGSSTVPTASTMIGASTSREQFSITPSFEHLNAVRIAVRVILDGLDDDTESLYLTAVTEIVTNAIEEHHRADSVEEITITVDCRNRSVEVRDRGRGYDPADRAARRDIDDGGWGLVIAEAGAPNLSWSHNPDGGTTFTLPVPVS